MRTSVHWSMGRLEERQKRESALLAAWWEAVAEERVASDAVRRAMAARDRAAGRLLGGMTARERARAERASGVGRASATPAARRQVIAVVHRREQLTVCDSVWAHRIARAEKRRRLAGARLAELAGVALAAWGDGCEQWTDCSRRRLAAVASGSSISVLPACRPR